MKILCAYSGIQFSCDHFPLDLYAKESFHPIFSVPQRKLVACLPKWAGNELTETDSYLLFLALLKSSDLVEFRTSAKVTTKTASLVAQNMEGLAKALLKLGSVSTPSVSFPHYVISPDTSDLSNIAYWIDNWTDSYQDFLDGYVSFHEQQKVNKKEQVVERLIKNPHKSAKEIAPHLAEWAAAAGDFPIGLVPSPFTKLNIPLAEYWKQIIVKCANGIQLFSIPRLDIQDLLDHCETNISYGSIYAHHLFKILRGALEKQKNFLDLGDLDLRTTSYQILDSTSTTESANMAALISSAPLEEPSQAMYSSKMEFLRAKMRWELARKDALKKGTL